jgi:hypothetical protein
MVCTRRVHRSHVVIFAREADRGQGAQGLVGPPAVVLHQPLHQALVEDRRISRHMAETAELLLHSPLEPVVDRMVLGRGDPGPVMFTVELLAGGLEVAVQFRSVVSLNILDFAVKPPRQAVEKIPGRRHAVRRLHPGTGHLGAGRSR